MATRAVRLTQYVHPDGRQRDTFLELDEPYAEIADGLILSCECMPNNYSQVIFYARRHDQNEEEEDMEIGTNGPGPDRPAATLRRLLDRFKGEEQEDGDPE